MTNHTSIDHPKPEMKFTFYYGSGRIMLAAKNFYLNRSNNHYKRLSVTFILACGEPFTLEIGDGTRLVSKTALIAPNVERSFLEAQDRDILIFDVPIQLPRHHDLACLFEGRNLIVPKVELFAEVIKNFDHLYTGQAHSSTVVDAYDKVIQILTPQNINANSLDPRIEKVMLGLENTPLEEISLETLAGSIHLSPSRLRHLFKEELGCTFSHYARWINVWKAVELWSMGKTFTEVAEATGFYDVAHLSRAFVDIFGLSPSDFLKSQGIKFVRLP